MIRHLPLIFLLFVLTFCCGASINLKLALLVGFGGLCDGELCPDSFHSRAWDGLVLANTTYNAAGHNISIEYAECADNNGLTEVNDFISRGFNHILLTGLIPMAISASLTHLDTHPNVMFSLIDAIIPNPLPNLQCCVFREDQVSFLAGLLAGEVSTSRILGVLNGFPFPAVKRFNNGFKNGVRRSCPSCVVLSEYMYHFFDGPGLPISDFWLGLGMDIIFSVSGPGGKKAMERVMNNTGYSIGVDSDEFFRWENKPQSQYVLTSALKKTDVVTFNTVKDRVDGVFEGGVVKVFDTKNHGVALAPCHDSCAAWPSHMGTFLAGVTDMLASGVLSTGVDVDTGMLLDDLNLEANQWSTIDQRLFGMIPEPRSGSSSSAVVTALQYDSGIHIYQFGGRFLNGSAVQELWDFDVHGRAWQIRNSMLQMSGTLPAARSDATFTEGSIFSNGSAPVCSALVLYGGDYGSLVSTSLLPNVDIYFYTRFYVQLQDYWVHASIVVAATTPESRQYHTAVNGALLNATIIVFGGKSAYGYLNDLWKLRIVGNQDVVCNASVVTTIWTPILSDDTLPSYPTARCKHTAVIMSRSAGVTNDSNASMYIFGGETENLQTLNDLYRLDFNTMEWHRLPDAPFHVKNHRSTVVRHCSTDDVCQDYMLIFGGFDEEYKLTENIYLFDPGSNEWFLHENSFTSNCSLRYSHILQTTGVERNVVYVFGGTYIDGLNVRLVSQSCVFKFAKTTANTKRILLMSYEQHPSLFAATYCLGGLGIVCCFVTMVLIYRYRREKVITAASVNFLMITAVGCIGVLVGVVLNAVRPTPTVCYLRVVVFSLSLGTVFGASYVKVWRVYRIFSSKLVKIQVISDLRLLAFLLLVNSFPIVLLITLGIVDYPRLHLVPMEADNDLYEACTVNSTVMALLLSYLLMVIIGGAAVSFKSRALPSQFNESRYIAVNIYNILVFSIIIVALNFILDGDPIGQFVTRVYGSVMCIYCIMIFLFLPKFVELFNCCHMHTEEYVDGEQQIEFDENEARTARTAIKEVRRLRAKLREMEDETKRASSLLTENNPNTSCSSRKVEPSTADPCEEERDISSAFTE